MTKMAVSHKSLGPFINYVTLRGGGRGGGGVSASVTMYTTVVCGWTFSLIIRALCRNHGG